MNNQHEHQNEETGSGCAGVGLVECEIRNKSGRWAVLNLNKFTAPT
jgi:hypothetical protein